MNLRVSKKNMYEKNILESIPRLHIYNYIHINVYVGIFLYDVCFMYAFIHKLIPLSIHVFREHK